MRKNGKRREQRGFTLIELMIVVVVIGILAAIGAANYYSARAKSYDASVKSDLRNAMVFIEDYNIQNEQLPPDLATFQAISGYELSPGVSWQTFQPVVVGGDDALDLELKHQSSDNSFAAVYPADQKIRVVP